MAIKSNLTTEFLRSLPFFQDLPAEDIGAFVKAASIRIYKKQQTIFFQGDSADHLYIVGTGWVKLFRQTPEGEQAVVGLFTKGDIFGEASIFSKANYTCTAEAAEESQVMAIPGILLRERARNNHEIMARVMNAMSHEMRNLQLENEHLTLMSAPQRVGCLLLQLSAGIPGQGGTLTFPYDKSLAAARLGMKPETFSRALAQLSPFGVTVKGSDIKIDSFSCLISYCCGHCSSLPGECRGSRGTEGCSGFCPGKNNISDF